MEVSWTCVHISELFQLVGKSTYNVPTEGTPLMTTAMPYNVGDINKVVLLMGLHVITCIIAFKTRTIQEDDSIHV